MIVPPKVIVSDGERTLCVWDLDNGAWEGNRVEVGAKIEAALLVPYYADMLLGLGYYPLPRELYQREAIARDLGFDARIDFTGWEPPPAKDSDGNWIVY